MATLAQAAKQAQSQSNQQVPQITAPPTAQQQKSSGNVSKAPRCADCGDAKFYRYDVPIDHPMFGKAFPCPSCNGDAVTIRSGLNEMERKVRMQDVITEGRPGTEKMVRVATEWIANGCKGFLTIHGEVGNGKSTVLKSIVNDCVERGMDVRYVTMTDVMAYAREAFSSEMKGDSDLGRIRQLANTQVLVIDEMDKARLSDYAREIQTHLFDARYRNAHALGTVVTWNGGFDAIDLPWVLSRLSQYPVVENNDKDMRPLLGGKE